MKKKGRLIVIIVFGIFAAVLFVLGLILFFASPDENIILSFIMILIGVVIMKIFDSVSVKICFKCGNHMHGCSYRYHTIRSQTKTNDKGYPTKEITIVKIEVECPECGAIKKVNKEFTTCNYLLNVRYDLENLINGYCEKKFKH